MNLKNYSQVLNRESDMLYNASPKSQPMAFANHVVSNSNFDFKMINHSALLSKVINRDLSMF